MSLNNSRYVLIEFPMQNKPMNIDQVIYLLLQEGKTPIVAHPERYSYVRETPNMLLEYIEQGVLFQTMGALQEYMEMKLKKLQKNF